MTSYDRRTYPLLKPSFPLVKILSLLSPSSVAVADSAPPPSGFVLRWVWLLDTVTSHWA